MNERTDTAVAARDRTDDPASSQPSSPDGSDHPSVAWLESEFPGWEVSIDATSGWGRGALRPLWIARRPGHHPQAELSAAKLHTRLTDYLEREARRRALSN